MPVTAHTSAVKEALNRCEQAKRDDARNGSGTAEVCAFVSFGDRGVFVWKGRLLMETLRKNRLICAVWLVLLLALQYCRVPPGGQYTMFIPAVLLALILFTRHIAVRALFYLWMGLVAVLNALVAAKYREIYSNAALLRHISTSAICVILAVSTAIWSYNQNHTKQ